MSSWNTSFRLVSGFYRPRQFEFNPNDGGKELIFGTLSGEICLVNTESDDKDGTCEEMDASTSAAAASTAFDDPVRYLGCFGDPDNPSDPILGICWLKRFNTDRFITGSSFGEIKMGSTNPLNFQGTETTHIVKEYEPFDKLTSIHVNSDNRFILTSGYTRDARIYDLETSQILADYENIHNGHINISRFCNLSPFVFATSSFDATCKLWDLRLPKTQTIYTVTTSSALVMINFSPDDTFLLASALDNEITQFLTVDGRKHTTYDLPKTGLEGNFTRAYYSTSGTNVVTGACEEQNVRLLCAASGTVLNTTEVYPQRKHSSLYVQSLRGSPASDESFAVLANYRDLPNREIVLVKLTKSNAVDDAMSCNTASDVKAPIKADPETETEAEAEAEEEQAISLHLPSPALAEMMSGLRRSAQAVSITLKSGISPSAMQALALTHDHFDYDEDAVRSAGIDVILYTGLGNVSGSGGGGQLAYVTGAHLFVLLSRCPAFTAMLQPGVHLLVLSLDTILEKTDPRMRPEVANLLLEYVYCGDAAIDLKQVRLASLRIACHDAPNDFFKNLLPDDEDDEDGEGDKSLGNSVRASKKSGIVHTEAVVKKGLLQCAASDDALWRQASTSTMMTSFLEQLVLAASTTGLERLLLKLQMVASKTLFPINCLDLIRLSETYGLPRLRAKCLHFLTYHWHLLVVIHPEVVNFTDANGRSLMREIQALRAAIDVPAVKVKEEALAISPDSYRRMLRKKGQGGAAVTASDCDDADSLGPDELPTLNPIEEEEEEEANLEPPLAQDNEESEENLYLWLRKGTSERPAGWLNELPRFYGHVVVPGPGDFLFVIGGRDRTRYHFPRVITSYHIPSCTFSMLDSSDATLPVNRNLDSTVSSVALNPHPDLVHDNSMLSLLFHAAAPVRDGASRRHILVSGGLTDHETGAAGDAKAVRAVLLLDTETMTWSRPEKVGYANYLNTGASPVGEEARTFSRLRHSLCVVYPTFQGGARKATPTTTALATTSSVQSALASRFGPLLESNPMYLPARCIRSQFIIFGGIHSGPAQHPQFYGDAKILVTVSPNLTTSDQSESKPLLTWVTTRINAKRPDLIASARIHHSACIAKTLLEHRGGVRLIIFGGIGPPDNYAEVRSLRLGNFARYTMQEDAGEPTVGDVAQRWDLEWEEVVMLPGPAPSTRYGHTMTSCVTENGEELLVLLGGTDVAISNRQLDMNEVWILHIVDSQRTSNLPQINWHQLTVRWEKAVVNLRAPLTAAPAPRMMHQALSTQPGRILVFGGCSGSLNNSFGCPSNVYELQVTMRGDTTHCTWGLLAASGDTQSSDKVGIDRQLEVVAEPTTTLKTDCLHSDLLQLFRTGNRSDLVFDLLAGPTQSVNGDGFTIRAHKSLVSRRCDVLKTMLQWQQERSGDGSGGEGVERIFIPDDDAGFEIPNPETSDEERATEQRQRLESRRRVFRAMLEFLYTDTLLCKANDVTSLLSLANRYQLSRLSQLCEAFLSRQVTRESAGPLLQFADWYSLETLKAVCFATILRLGTDSAADPDVEALGLGNELEELSPELRAEVDTYRREASHAYIVDNSADNQFVQGVALTTTGWSTVTKAVGQR